MRCPRQQLFGICVGAATGKKDVVWFALNDDWPLFVFAGIWTFLLKLRARRCAKVLGSFPPAAT
jgi:hypothetical protein